jgi:succinoglycan biosynthesis protein ExoA
MLQLPRISSDTLHMGNCKKGSPRMQIAEMKQELPLVSVIMPVRNESAYIRRSLAAVLAQDYPADLIEVIVADGMSTDGTRQMVQAAQTEHPNVRLLDNPRLIAPTALNLATATALGEIIVRVDGHCEIEPDYVTNCVRHLLDGEAEGVGGSVETVGETATARVIAVAMSSPFGVGGTAFRTTKGRTMLVDTIPFPAYSRKTVQAAGPYDETLVRDQDDEYNYRIRKLGGRLLLAADVNSRYYSRAGLTSLWRQYFGYGYWKARVLWRHPRQMKLRQFVPAAFVVCLGLGAALCPFSRPVRRLIRLALLAYGSASGLASARAAAQTDRRDLPKLPAAFAAMHLSYGAGFLLGNAAIVVRKLRQGSSEARVP